MDTATLIQSLAPMPLFASRPFLAAFGVAMGLRHGWLTLGHPSWFVHDVTLWVLGALALVDVLARHNVDLRPMVEEVDGWLKGGVAVVVHLGIADPASAALLQTVVAAGLGPAFGLSTLVGAGVWGLAVLRRGTLRLLEEIDEYDDLGLQGLIAWAEDLGVAGGVVVAVLLPAVALVLFALTLLGLWLFRLGLRRMEERAKAPCSHCGAPLHPSATACASCGGVNPAIRAAGLFGRPTARPAPVPERHRLTLLAWRRCPRCATPLPKRRLRQPCPACGRVVFHDRAEMDGYLAAVRGRLPKVMTVCFVAGFVPLLGLVVGVVYYRLSVIAGLRRYVPMSVGCFTRWGVRFVNLVLVMLQPVPILGAFTLPLMCWTNHAVWSRAMRGGRWEEGVGGGAEVVGPE